VHSISRCLTAEGQAGPRVLELLHQRRITNSKDLHEHCMALQDPVGSANFLSDEGDIESALLRLKPTEPPLQKACSRRPDGVVWGRL
jgi:hypothetical protein